MYNQVSVLKIFLNVTLKKLQHFEIGRIDSQNGDFQ